MSRATQSYIIQIFISLILSFLVSPSSWLWFEIISVGTFIFFIIKFTYDLGNNISVKNIIAIIASMQWLLGPVLGYHYNDFIFTNYQMAVPKEQYFLYILPACFAYFIALYSPFWKSKAMLDFKNYPIDYYAKGMAFIILGFIGGILPLGFLSFILGGLKYVGLFYMFASKNPLKYYWIASVFGMLLLSSIRGAAFHDLILWSSFFMMLYFIFRKVKFISRLNYIVLGLTLVLVVQFVKSDYRLALSSNFQGKKNAFELYWQVLKSKFNGTIPVFSEENIASNVVRLNQGWIISHVMQNIPAKSPYANGESIKGAIFASILPRIIAPNKAIAGGRSNMENYAGIVLNETTSMDISQIGEAYANFGILGGILFMFFLGLFFNWVISYINRKCLKYPDLIFWIPLIFLQAVKAETSLVTVLNHVTKTALVAWFFFSPWGNFLINRFFVRKRVKAVLN